MNKLLWNLLIYIKFDINQNEGNNRDDIINKIFHTMRYQNIYEKVMKNKKHFLEIDKKMIITYYYSYNYPFPNVNLLFYNNDKKIIWLDKINKLYFNPDPGHKNWDYRKYS